MSDAQPTRTAPTVPDFQNQPEPSIADTVLAQVIARTIETVEARGPRPSPFRLDTFEDIENFADKLARSGLCPKDYKNKPDDIIIAVLLGKEIGLPAMASVQSIAVINGRPSLWGEAVPGLCMATGQVVDVVEHFEGEDGSEAFAAVCTVTRKGYSPREGRFSAADRKRAGLTSVHATYPKDMLMWRARHRAWHGLFPDVLRGLGTAEIDADEASRPEWRMPRPERAATARATKAEGDTWDDAWFDATAKALFDEQDPWKWLDLLRTSLTAAPTLRDVREIEGLGTVTRAIASAPDEVKQTISEAFVEADKRLGKPPLAEEAPPESTGAKTDAKPKRERKKAAATAPVEQVETPAESEPEFEYCVLGDDGEPLDGEIITDPLAWAEAFRGAIDPHHSGYEAAIEHNADAIADAKADPDAAKILEAMEAEADAAHAQSAEGEASEPATIEPTMVRGKPDWPQYIRDLTAALAVETADSLGAFIEAQRARAEKFPASTRLQATKAIVERARALGIAPPAGFAGAEPAPPVTDTAAPPADQPPPRDKDRISLDGIKEHLATLTQAHAVTSYSNQIANRTLLERWKREERTDLVEEMTQAFATRTAEIARGEV